MAWSEIALGDLVELKRGYDLPAAARRPGDVPVVSSRGVLGEHDTARVRAPGVVTGRTGTLGEVLFLDRDFWPLNTTLFVRDFKGNDPRFVGYLLETVDYARLSDKAAVPGVSRDQLHRLPVRRPPLREQRALARRLAPFDAKIALLRRMDRTLAAIARAHFDGVPGGSPRSVAECCLRIVNGGTPPRAEPGYWNGPVPWFKSGELDDGPLVRSRGTITERALRETGARLLAPGTVLLALYASPTVGRLGVLDLPAAANQACCALTARPGHGPWLLFHALLENRALLRHRAVGAVQQNISQRVVREVVLDLPPPALARAFEGRVAALHALRAAQAREAAALKALRDALLGELLGRAAGRPV